MLKNIICYMQHRTAVEEAKAFAVRYEGTELQILLWRAEPEKRLQWDQLALQDTLFITDSNAAAQMLLKQGAFVAALLTQDNRDEPFQGVAYAIEQLCEIELSYLNRIYDRCVGDPWEILHTDRCLLREITPEDIDSLYRIYEEPSITYYMEPLYEDREQELAYTKEYIKNVYGYFGYGMWVVVCQENGEIIGRAGLEYKEESDGLEMGYVIAKPYQRQGYAEEVCRALLQYAQEQLSFETVSSYVEIENEASIALCRKLGMELSGRKELAGKEYLIFQKRSAKEMNTY